MPNISADKDIVPEIIEKSANPDFIAYNIEKLLYDESCRNSQINSLKEVGSLLSNKNSSLEVAKRINEELLEV